MEEGRALRLLARVIGECELTTLTGEPFTNQWALDDGSEAEPLGNSLPDGIEDQAARFGTVEDAIAALANGNTENANALVPIVMSRVESVGGSDRQAALDAGGRSGGEDLSAGRRAGPR